MPRLLFVLSLFISLNLNGQNLRSLQVIMRLNMPSGGGDNGGTVALNLKNRNYYATIAGSKAYSMAIFNGGSELLSPPDLALLYDIRGLWYHPVEKTFYANAFGSTGWIKYTIDESGIPYDASVKLEGQRQPFPQSVGQFSQRENIVYFLKGSMAMAYDVNTGNLLEGKHKLLKIGFGKKSLPPAGWQADSFTVRKDYNTTTLIYTGLAQAEFGLLNIENREIELYSATDGLMSTRLKIPDQLPVHDKLNFAFCNNLFWLYDSKSRSWAGMR